MNKKFLQRIHEINKNIHIRQAGHEDIPEVCKLINEVFVNQKKTESYFTWQLFDCPHQATMFLLIDNENIVGCCGVRICEIVDAINDDSFIGGFTFELVIKEDYRNRGLYFLFDEAIVEFAQSHDVAILTSLPNLYGKNAHVAADWNNIGTIDSLYAERIQPAKIKQECNARFYFRKDRWRLRHPTHSYITYEVGQNVYVTKQYKKENITDLVDYQIDNLNDISQLLKITSPIETWATSGGSMSAALETLGFVKKDRPPRYFCIKVLKDNMDHFLRFYDWQIVPIDSEIF